MPDEHHATSNAIHRLWERHSVWVDGLSLWARLLEFSCCYWLLCGAYLLIRARLGSPGGLDVAFTLWSATLCGLCAAPLYHLRLQRLPRLPRPFSVFDLLLLGGLYALLIRAYATLKVLLGGGAMDLGYALLIGLAWLFATWFLSRTGAGPYEGG